MKLLRKTRKLLRGVSPLEWAVLVLAAILASRGDSGSLVVALSFAAVVGWSVWPRRGSSDGDR